MFLRAKRSKNPTDFAKCKKIRNEVTMMLRAAKQNYLNTLMSANSKKFWKMFKLVNKQQELLSHDNVDAVTDEEKSITKGHFPKLWKVSRVVPIPKTKAKSSPSGYRPISLLSIPSKLLHSLITDHLTEHYPLSDAQWEFQKGKSTLTALLAATHDWLTHLDQSNVYFLTSRKLLMLFPTEDLWKR